MRSIILKFVGEHGIDLKTLLTKLERYINIDDLSLHRLWDYLLEHNIVIEVDSRFRRISTLSRM